MRHWQRMGAAIALMVSAVSAQAAEKSWTVSGSGLKIATPCAKTVDIQAVDIQAGGDVHQIKISASADRAEEIDQLKVAGGDPATIDIGNARCWFSGLISSERPTLALIIKVPEGTALEIGDGGIASYMIGPVGGPLHVALAGASGLKAAHAKELTIALSGSGSADIDSVDGKVAGRLSGAGDLTVNHLHSTRTDLDLSGKGAVTLNEGDAGQLTASVHGAGSLRAPAATAARLSNSGSGAILLKSVKGALDADLSGAGTLTVDAVEVSSGNIEVTGHSNVKLGPGTIANLSMSSSGASDVEVDAIVTDLTVSAVGSGDIRFAKVTGRVSQSSTGSAKIVVGR